MRVEVESPVATMTAEINGSVSPCVTEARHQPFTTVLLNGWTVVASGRVIPMGAGLTS